MNYQFYYIDKITCMDRITEFSVWFYAKNHIVLLKLLLISKHRKEPHHEIPGSNHCIVGLGGMQ